MAYTQQFTSAKMGEEIEELENTPRNQHTHTWTHREATTEVLTTTTKTHKHTQRQEELQQQS
jgi:hypothetical protein